MTVFSARDSCDEFANQAAMLKGTTFPLPSSWFAFELGHAINTDRLNF